MTTAPTRQSERIAELDVLRGFALLGVFIVHFAGLVFYELPMPATIREGWQLSPLQQAVAVFSDIGFQNKANSLFATLFGMGFWLMMERLAARGPGAGRLYLRRLAILLALGAANVIFIFPGDVLFDYAALGFVLFALRKLPPCVLLTLGLVLGAFGQVIGDQVSALLTPDSSVESAPEAYTDQTYGAWLSASFHRYYDENIAYLGGLGWWLYLLGRFLVGAWIMQQPWMRALAAHRGEAARLASFALPLGLVFEIVSLLTFRGLLPLPTWVDLVFHGVGAPLMAVGYAAALASLFARPNTRSWVTWLAPVGRIALTAYLAHGFVYAVLFLPLGPNFAGQITPAASLGICLALYAGIAFFSTRWLARYRFGPVEYLWRWGTYGQRPQLKFAA